MGSAKIQGELWGAKAADWAEVQEPGWHQVYAHVFGQLGVGVGTRVLDVGCGAGGALQLARSLGAEVSGIDAAASLVAIARARLPGARIEIGDMENLPFAADCFDVVTGFNSFQFAGDIVQALREARRVCRQAGSVAMLFWGRKEECDLIVGLMPAVLSLLPAGPAPATPARPPLSDRGVAEGLMRDAGFSTTAVGDVDCPLLYPDAVIAMRALASAAPFVRAERHAGRDVLEATVTAVLPRFTGADGSVRLSNRMRYVIGTRE
jgi:SAM-dependent methyltransferase